MTKKPPKQNADVEGDPKRGDEILKRMLQTKPKQHKELVKERKAKRQKGKRNASSAG
jgi:hypothetical protein